MDGEKKYCISNGTLFLTGNLLTTSSLRAAGKWNAEKVENVIKSVTQSRKFRNQDFKVIEYDHHLQTEQSILKEDIIGVTSLIDKLKDITEQTEDMKQYNDFLLDQLSVIDQAITDIEHYIEFAKVDACKGYKAYKMLQDKLLIRRKIKDSIRLIGSLKGVDLLTCKTTRVSKVYGQVQAQQYNSRVIHELFEQQ
jgi:hypothetical protein